MCDECEREREKPRKTEMEDLSSIWRTNVVLVRGFTPVFVTRIFSFKHEVWFYALQQQILKIKLLILTAGQAKLPADYKPKYWLPS